MKISTVIANYNCNRAYIEEAIQSIIDQTIFNNKEIENEIIFVDDGSDEDPKNILQFFSEVKYIKLKENHGFAYARNLGIANTTGDFIALQDSDDYSYPKRFEKEYNKLKEMDLIYISCGMNMEYVNQKSKIITEVIKNYSDPMECRSIQIYKPKMKNGIYEKPFFDAPSFFTKEIREKGIGYDEDMKVGADWTFELKIQKNFPNKMFIISDILYHYRRHNNSLVQKYLYGKREKVKTNYELINKRIEEYRKNLF